MFQKIRSCVCEGLHAVYVDVEVDTMNGLPYLSILGIPQARQNTIRERIRSAIHAAGLSMPAGRVTINLVSSSSALQPDGLDLPIALGILCADRSLPDMRNENTAVIGALSLDGKVRAVPGIISILQTFEQMPDDIRPQEVMIPSENAAEAACIQGLRLIPVSHFEEALAYWKGQLEILPLKAETPAFVRPPADRLKSIRGQLPGKRALLIAAAGFHNLLLAGPPGCGKTMLAQSAPSIMPMPQPEETERILAVRSYQDPGGASLLTRPVRTPHTSVTSRVLYGGRKPLWPGELALADGGLLILDEIAEFPRHLLDGLRQPLESHQIHHAGKGADITYSTDFMTIATMNLCPCGLYPDQERCRCSIAEIRRYQGRLGEPLLERFDMILRLDNVSPEETEIYDDNDIDALRGRIEAAAARQRSRYRGEAFLYNSRVPASDICRLIPLSDPVASLLRKASHQFHLSMRTQHNAIRTARTLADLSDQDEITSSHMLEALQYRPRGFLLGDGG